MIRVCILCYKLFWGNSTLCVSLVLFFSFVRVNAQFVKLNAQFARVNAQLVRENAHPEYPKNALFCVCKTKRTLLPFRRLPVSVYLYNSPVFVWKSAILSDRRIPLSFISARRQDLGFRTALMGPFSSKIFRLFRLFSNKSRKHMFPDIVPANRNWLCLYEFAKSHGLISR